MGRGNVSVSEPYEGLYYIDYDDFYMYSREDPVSGESETRLKRDLSYADLIGSEWVYDELNTAEEERDILDWFTSSFTRLFPSFQRPVEELWIRNGPWGDYSRKVILENKLYYIAIEDNEWSLAVELLQKEAPYNELCFSDEYNGLVFFGKDYVAKMASHNRYKCWRPTAASRGRQEMKHNGGARHDHR